MDNVPLLSLMDLRTLASFIERATAARYPWCEHLNNHQDAYVLAWKVEYAILSIQINPTTGILHVELRIGAGSLPRSWNWKLTKTSSCFTGGASLEPSSRFTLAKTQFENLSCDHYREPGLLDTLNKHLDEAGLMRIS